MLRMQAVAKKLMTIAVVACFLAGAAGSASSEDPWADEVVAFNQGPYPGPGACSDPVLALGEPHGGGTRAPDNSSLVSLGSQGGSLVLKFTTSVTDDPNNPMGLDCIVYGNALYVGGNPQRKWQEPALIEISEDANANGLADDPWYMIPGSRGFRYDPFPWTEEPDGTANSEEEPYLLGGNITNPNLLADADPGNDDEEFNWGYGEMTPTIQPYLDNHVRPEDPFTVGHDERAGGGDAFDIAWAVDAAGNPAGIAQFHFIRFTSFILRYAQQLGYISPEIDAVADVAPDVDTDGDGLLDEYETRVAGTHPARPESTVLPLEIPYDEGGSPAGTLLGTAEDDRGTKLRLYAANERPYGLARNVTVDILAPTAPSAPLPSPDLLLSGTVREIVSSETDFVAAQIQPAEVTIQYSPLEIAGLDEPGLQPYLFTGAVYAQGGISEVDLNQAANVIKFRSQYAGLFVLASTAGEGDTGDPNGPKGAIALTADPQDAVVADPANSVTVASGTIRDAEELPVGDGTLITVAATRGQVTTPDASPTVSGVQVETDGATIAFTVQAATASGSVLFSASSVTGSAYGELAYALVPGPPAPPVSWRLGEPEGTGPVAVEMGLNVVRDQFSNVVANGTLLTVDVAGATITSGDADLAQGGHQVALVSGGAELDVEALSRDAVFVLSTYADSAQTILLGQQAFSPQDYVPMPVGLPYLMVAVMAVVFAVRVGRTFAGL